VPYINGRYYMNPQYGAAVEAARSGESDDVDDDGFTTEPQIELLSAQKASQQQPTKPQIDSPRTEKHFSGDATYYNLPGSKTASGRPFNSDAMSAAMTGEKTRMGQHVTVTYSGKDAHGKTTTKSIKVIVDDRGPFARDQSGKPLHPLRPDPRGVIDLTPAAFKALTGSLKQGRVPVTVTVPNE
jgi:rare lipoprotein A (peptidoglycan hydrolase)